MEILTSSNNVTIKGNIKSINDYQNIKNTLDTLKSQHKSLSIEITDSISITSSIIGYLNKLVLKDNINLTMKIGSDQLFELLEDLNLASTFKAIKA